LSEHGFGVIGEYLRGSAEAYNYVAAVASERGPSAWLMARLDRRNTLLREVAAVHFAGMPPTSRPTAWRD
jgi:hypothetical protein